MDPALQTLKAALEAIRDTAMSALTRIGQSQEEYSMRWICKQCRYTKHFTRPVPLEGAGNAQDAKAQSLNQFCDHSFALTSLSTFSIQVVCRWESKDTSQDRQCASDKRIAAEIALS
jgi:hypothetical protein